MATREGEFGDDDDNIARVVSVAVCVSYSICVAACVVRSIAVNAVWLKKGNSAAKLCGLLTQSPLKVFPIIYAYREKGAPYLWLLIWMVRRATTVDSVVVLWFSITARVARFTFKNEKFAEKFKKKTFYYIHSEGRTDDWNTKHL